MVRYRPQACLRAAASAFCGCTLGGPLPSLPDTSIYNLKEDAIGVSTRRPVGIVKMNGEAQCRQSLSWGQTATRT